MSDDEQTQDFTVLEAAPRQFPDSAALSPVLIEEGADAFSEELPEPTEPRYEVGELLGRGGMGEVRSYFDRRIGRSIAVKTFSAGSNRNATARFLREARVQAQLQHPSIVPVYELATRSDGTMFFAMQVVRGRTLKELFKLLAQGVPEVATFTRTRLLGLFVQVCLAVHYAHCRGVLHRDLKPANLMVGDFGEVYVLDWGIARTFARSEEKTDPQPASDESNNTPGQNTEEGAMLGTLGYMAPEQLVGIKDLDARADVFSLGAILYELLTLHTLIPRESRDGMISATVAGVDARPSRWVSDLPVELDQICLKATAVDHGQRYESARALSEAVERFLDGDRDLERRREQSLQHASLAQKLTEQVFASNIAPAEAQEARAAALKEAINALSLDSTSRSARASLAQLLLRAPEHPPPEVRSRIEAAEDEARLASLNLAFPTLCSWLIFLPLVWWSGLRSSFVALCGLVLILGGIALVRAGARLKKFDGTISHLLAFCIFANVALMSSWLGPFVLAPAAATSCAVLFSWYARSNERWRVYLLAVLASLLPLVLEGLGVVSPGFVFRDNTVVLLPRATDLAPTPTLFAIVYTMITFVLVPPWYLGRVREQIRTQEQQRFLNAWQMEQLTQQ